MLEGKPIVKHNPISMSGFQLQQKEFKRINTNKKKTYGQLAYKAYLHTKSPSSNDLAQNFHDQLGINSTYSKE